MQLPGPLCRVVHENRRAMIDEPALHTCSERRTG
jgi:hypothetical protein